MELAAAGAEGRRLGQVNSVRMAAATLGSALVFFGFSRLQFSYKTTFSLQPAVLLLRFFLPAAVFSEYFFSLFLEKWLIGLGNEQSSELKDSHLLPSVLVTGLQKPFSVSIALIYAHAAGKIRPKVFNKSV